MTDDPVNLYAVAAQINRGMIQDFLEIERLVALMDETPERWKDQCIGWRNDRPTIVKRKDDNAWRP